MTSPLKSSRVRCGVACFITNEADFLREWIEFHRLVGFEGFLIYDNGSGDGPEEVLRPYLRTGVADYLPWPNPRGPENFHLAQLAAYEDAIAKARGRFDWLAILDCDEFLFAPDRRPVPEVLLSYSDYPAVGVNWQVFGTSGVHDLHPGECLIEKLTWKRHSAHPGNAHIKSIVQPEEVVRVETQHNCAYRDGRLAVNTDHQPITGPHSAPPRWDVLRINHYMFRTERFFRKRKIPMMQQSGRYQKRAQTLENEGAFREEKDVVIHAYLHKLKSRIRPILH